MVPLIPICLSTSIGPGYVHLLTTVSSQRTSMKKTHGQDLSCGSERCELQVRHFHPAFQPAAHRPSLLQDATCHVLNSSLCGRCGVQGADRIPLRDPCALDTSRRRALQTCGYWEGIELLHGPGLRLNNSCSMLQQVGASKM